MNYILVPISCDFITLGQFLKLQNIAGSGSEAKFLIQEGKVLVGEEIELRRGRKLYTGDIISVFAQKYQLVAAVKGGPES
jgi:ribosome-associated protein